MSEFWNGRTESFEPIPDAPVYVLSNDKCMSGWGKARGKINTCVVPCSSVDMARAIVAYVESRTEQKYIRLRYSKPQTRSHVLYSLQLGWIERAVEYSTSKREYCLGHWLDTGKIIKCKS